jgi:hypothetical protein
MNAKYIITREKLGGGSEPLFQSQQTGAFVYYNPAYCKRAFFVDSVIVEEDDYIILQHLVASNFNPKTTAYIEKPLAQNITPSKQYAIEMRDLERQIQEHDPTFKISEDINEVIFNPTAKILEYKNEYIKVETETKSQHLLVLSEMYYPVS